MKILFMGTPDFAVSVLDELIRSDHEIVGAVSQPDKPKGRGHKLMPTEVKLKAEEHGIKVFQPLTLKNGAFSDTLEMLAPDMIVVAAYGKILPDYIIDYPRLGCINVHASLLPKYRGAAPIQWAVINGEEKTGVTIMRMSYGLDTGDIISIAETPIGEYETSGELFGRLAEIGAKLLVGTIDSIEDGTAVYRKQNEEKATYAQMISRETAMIDWTKSAAEISKLICGMNPYPGAITSYEGNALKIYEAEITDAAGAPGEILGVVKKKGILVACGKNGLFLRSVQFAGSKRMNAEDYARGHDIVEGVILC